MTPSAASIEIVKAVCSGASFLAVIRLRPSSVAALGGQGQADQAAAVLGHEVDGLGRRELGRHHEVALVLAVLVVADDDHAAAADLLDRLLDRREGRVSSVGAGGSTGSGLSSFGHLVLVLSFGSEALQESLGVAGDDVDLDVEPAARSSASPRVVRSSVSGISETSTPSSPSAGDREADAVEGDRAVLDHVAEQLVAERDRDPAGEAVLGDADDLADAVDVALDDVAAERVAGPQRRLEVDRRARLEVAERGQRRASGSSRRRRSRRRRARSTVRQTPLTATESPSPSSAASAVAIRSRAPSAPCSIASTSPRSAISPVNMLPVSRGTRIALTTPAASPGPACRRRRPPSSIASARSASPRSGGAAAADQRPGAGAAEQLRRDEDAQLVDRAGVEEGAGERRRRPRAAGW